MILSWRVESTSMSKKLTTTSYAVLGLLSLKSWTAYELTKQMSRSMSHIWPRAVSAVYREPKTLVAHGLAEASLEDSRERRRTRYSITPAGRRALARWLTQPTTAPPEFESEALVRVEFAEMGTKKDLLRTLRALREQAEALKARRLAQLTGYLVEGGPFPERMHIHALIGPLVVEQAALLGDWARRAEEEITRWPDVSADAAAARGTEIIRDFLVRSGVGGMIEITERMPSTVGQ
jgi:PadR family transcriptional regulator, regulatory protein AphA